MTAPILRCVVQEVARRRSLWRRIPREFILTIITLAIVAGLFQFARGMLYEYDRMSRAVIAAKARAARAEQQLALMLQHGDSGIALAEINVVDLGPVELRLAPKFKREEK